MAILGMRGSGSWATNEQPTNFREKILYLYPDSPAILTMLTSKLKSENTDDATFTIFEKGLPPARAEIDEASMSDLDADTKIYLVTSGEEDYFTAGDVVIVERTQEVMIVTSTGEDGTGPYVQVAARGHGSSSAADVADGDYLLVIGSMFAEGADTPAARSHNVVPWTNYTQIFRNSMHLTGTMKQTYLRTGEVEQELKRETAERHAIAMEWAWLFGVKSAGSGTGIGSGQYARTTGGLLERISTNVTDFSGSLNKADWESFLEGVFLVPNGRSEKLCICGNKALTALNAMAQAYGEIQLVPTSEAYGMKFQRYETPYGTLMVKGHQLLSQNAGFNDWGFVVDMSNIVYRPLRNRDTKFLKDRQSNGADAIIHEFLTEAGLEIRHESTHGVFKNATAFVP
jgi:hypothetical protein